MVDSSLGVGFSGKLINEAKQFFLCYECGQTFNVKTKYEEHVLLHQAILFCYQIYEHETAVNSVKADSLKNGERKNTSGHADKTGTGRRNTLADLPRKRSNQFPDNSVKRKSTYPLSRAEKAVNGKTSTSNRGKDLKSKAGFNKTSSSQLVDKPPKRKLASVLSSGLPDKKSSSSSRPSKRKKPETTTRDEVPPKIIKTEETQKPRPDATEEKDELSAENKKLPEMNVLTVDTCDVLPKSQLSSPSTEETSGNEIADLSPGENSIQKPESRPWALLLEGTSSSSSVLSTPVSSSSSSSSSFFSPSSTNSSYSSSSDTMWYKKNASTRRSGSNEKSIYEKKERRSLALRSGDDNNNKRAEEGVTTRMKQKARKERSSSRTSQSEEAAAVVKDDSFPKTRSKDKRKVIKKHEEEPPVASEDGVLVVKNGNFDHKTDEVPNITVAEKRKSSKERQLPRRTSRENEVPKGNREASSVTKAIPFKEKDDLKSATKATPLKEKDDLKSITKATPLKEKDDLKSVTKATPLKEKDDLKSVTKATPLKEIDDLKSVTKAISLKEKDDLKSVTKTTTLLTKATPLKEKDDPKIVTKATCLNERDDLKSITKASSLKEKDDLKAGTKGALLKVKDGLKSKQDAQNERKCALEGKPSSSKVSSDKDVKNDVTDGSPADKSGSLAEKQEGKPGSNTSSPQQSSNIAHNGQKCVACEFVSAQGSEMIEHVTRQHGASVVKLEKRDCISGVWSESNEVPANEHCVFCERYFEKATDYFIHIIICHKISLFAQQADRFTCTAHLAHPNLPTHKINITLKKPQVL